MDAHEPLLTGKDAYKASSENLIFVLYSISKKRDYIEKGVEHEGLFE